MREIHAFSRVADVSCPDDSLEEVVVIRLSNALDRHVTVQLCMSIVSIMSIMSITWLGMLQTPGSPQPDRYDRLR